MRGIECTHTQGSCCHFFLLQSLYLVITNQALDMTWKTEKKGLPTNFSVWYAVCLLPVSPLFSSDYGCCQREVLVNEKAFEPFQSFWLASLVTSFFLTNIWQSNMHCSNDYDFKSKVLFVYSWNLKQTSGG